jgi:hypothetical protein
MAIFFVCNLDPSDTRVNQLDPLWRLWLYYRRDDIPSETEVQKDVKRIQMYQKKVKEFRKKK